VNGLFIVPPIIIIHSNTHASEKKKNVVLFLRQPHHPSCSLTLLLRFFYSMVNSSFSLMDGALACPPATEQTSISTDYTTTIFQKPYISK
jgi:hypothetical protein